MGRNLKINRDFVLFAAGTIVGAATTWMCLKSKYDKRLKEDIDSVKESLGLRHKREEKLEDEAVVPYSPTKDDLETLKKTIETNRYVNYSKKEEEEKEMNKPYIISPDEFNENGYDTQSLICWDDGIVTDDDGNVIDDYDVHIGEDALNHFGEYEDDSVFVRNDEEQMDYEILLDTRKYHDVYKDC